jgi:branched-chain amino acid transport system permease protein
MSRRLSSTRAMQLVLTVVLLVTGFTAPQFLRPYLLGLLTLGLIFGLFAMSINLLAGHAGLVSAGHGGILGAAAYGVGYVARGAGTHLRQIVVGLAVGMVATAIFGAVAMRTARVYFIMVTLALGMLVWGAGFRLARITGGENGLTGIARPPGVALYWQYYYLCLIVVALCVLFMWVIVRSPFGLALRGLRDSESRLRALGYNTTAHKFYAFMLSGFFATIAGILLVYYFQFTSPATASFQRSSLGIMMVVLGGVGTALGPLVGSFVVVLVENVVSGFLERWPTAMGLIFVFTVLFARRGIVGSLGQLWMRTVGPGEAGAPVPAALAAFEGGQAVPAAHPVKPPQPVGSEHESR